MDFSLDPRIVDVNCPPAPPYNPSRAEPFPEVPPNPTSRHQLVHYSPKEFDFGKKKGFPFRDQHFFASIEKAKAELDWAPEFGLLEGLKDSYSKDFGRGGFREAADFSTDDMVIEKLGKKTAVKA